MSGITSSVLWNIFLRTVLLCLDFYQSTSPIIEEISDIFLSVCCFSHRGKLWLYILHWMSLSETVIGRRVCNRYKIEFWRMQLLSYFKHDLSWTVWHSSSEFGYRSFPLLQILNDRKDQKSTQNGSERMGTVRFLTFKQLSPVLLWITWAEKSHKSTRN